MAFLDNLILPNQAELEFEICCNSLREFYRRYWVEVVPDRLKWAWYIDAIADHIEAFHAGQIRKLLINMPFRLGKSVLCNVLYPAWAWLRDPGTRFFSASHSLAYATRDTRFTRQVITSARYVAMNTDASTGKPRWELAGDQNQKGYFENSLKGYRLATHVGAGTGSGGDVNILDDPASADQARSNAERESCSRWFWGTFYSRQNDPEKTRILCVQQRLHPKDTSGEILAKNIGFDHLCISMEFSDRRRKGPTSIGWVDPRKEEGELLAPDRFPQTEIDSFKVALGPDWEAQANQDPQEVGGNLIDESNLPRWRLIPESFDRVIQSWDCALKGDEQDKPKGHAGRSYVVGTVWGFKGTRAWLLWVERGRWGIVETIEAIKRVSAMWPAALEKYIEDKANGPAIMDTLKESLHGLIPVEPMGSKYARFAACVPYFKAGQICVPENDLFPWVDAYVSELTGFPNTGQDDQVDSTSQAIKAVWQSRNGGFGYSMGPDGDAPEVTDSPTSSIRAAAQLAGRLEDTCRRMMGIPAHARVDEFWRRWGMIQAGRDLDPAQAEPMIQTSGDPDRLAKELAGCAFGISV
ncbi:MAG: phage terminase large subunit, partial [Planctomycetales bacterium]|nr:phage terminase large subunit [Planctomycetales bacterium]